ncbi:lipocalin family protein [Cohnella abietis]|uniref:Carotenoid 1,2-hydratase n=1 Tax=Cohnella abietis TaxID=2507935 RepID=A0A3T1DDZ3_9BACL|nr:lipocalin family protein [Cohnella abietis]BBI36386.1 carotenoid 1,2-hydratase [Cohnella abietis]
MYDERGSVSIPKDAAVHPTSNVEWWYCYSFISGSRGSQYALMASFFRVGELPGIKGHYLIYSLIRLDNPQSVHRSFLDRPLTHLMTGMYLPLYFLLKPADRHTWGQYGKLLKGQLPSPHAWLKNASASSHPTVLHYDHAHLTFKDDRSQEFILRIDDPEANIEIKFTPSKRTTIVDEKGTVNGLYYYSSTQNTVSGYLHHHDGSEQVSGEGWFDHQWGRYYGLLRGEGWNWFGLQFDDGRELLISQIRTAKSTSPPTAIFILKDSALTSVNSIKLQPLRYWKSLATLVNYPVEWHISIPDYELELHVIPMFDSQEMPIIGPLQAIWEGACTFYGIDHRNRRSIRGKGFLELAGYAM